MKKSRKFLNLIIAIGLVSATAFSNSATAAPTSDYSPAKATEQITGTNDLVESTTLGVAENKLAIVDIPTQFESEITIHHKETGDQLEIGIPNNMELNQPTLTAAGSYEYKNDDAVDLIIQPTELGVRTTMSIKDDSAPKEYRFDLALPEGHHLISSADYLGEEPGGKFDTKEIFVVDENNIIQSIFGAAWAKDANGRPVPSHYEIEGETLIQVVNFNQNTAFPVLADPDWVAIGACSAALVWFVGSNLFVAAKIIKVKKYINQLGGFKETAKIIAGATTWEEKLKVGGSALRSLAAEITGVTGLYACSKFIKR